MSARFTRGGAAAPALLVLALAGAASAQETSALQSRGPTTEAPPLGKPHLPHVRTGDYAVLDNVEGPAVDLLLPPVDPMILVGPVLYALNAHGSELLRYTDFFSGPEKRIPLPWGPASVASWFDGDGVEHVLVTCRGNYGLVFVDPIEGRIEAIVELPAEPADIEVVEELDLALVACAAVDAVVQIDLVAREVTATYPVRSKAPTFLTRGPGTTVLAAPLLSGNNSTVHRDFEFPIFAGPLGIVDGEGPGIVQGLPDEDLFLIDPLAGTIEAVARDVGTILFDLERHPTTGDVWVLNTEADNKDSEKVGEAALRGDFVHDRVSIVPLSAGGELATPSKVVDLDALALGDPVGQPYVLEFNATGFALVGGLLTDNVAILDPTGAEVGHIGQAEGIPEGAIVRDLALGPGQALLFVYCWGTNTVEVILLNQSPFAHVTSLDLGHDPSPFQRGRALFYDGKNSARKNVSCASCHVEGRTDMLLWDLSDKEKDDKGPLVTQSMAGIDKTPPFHWRGERPGLLDFNGAFDGLLGGERLDEAPGGDFDAFRDFVFSVQNPANPHQDPRRILNGALAEYLPSGGLGDPVAGQEHFIETPSLLGATCQECHTLPTAASGDSFGDTATNPNPRRTNLDVPHFQEIYRKAQEEVQFVFVNGLTLDVALIGAGLTHAGSFTTLDRFHSEIFSLPVQVEASIVEFVRQIDQGIAPAVHKAYLLDETTAATVGPELTSYLLPQAEKRNADLAVWGEVTHGPDAGPSRWFWNRATGLFEPEDSGAPPRALSWFLAPRVLRDGTWFVFAGQPVGAGERFAVDFDLDELRNADEAAHGTDPLEPDSDGDGFRDGHEVAHGASPLDDAEVPSDRTPPSVSNVRVLWTSAKHARVQWETDEPTVYQLRYETEVAVQPAPVRVAPPELELPLVGLPTGDGTATEPVVSLLSARGPTTFFAKTHSVVLPDLLPSTRDVLEFTYTGEIRATDLGGNTTVVPLPELTTKPFIRFSEEQVKLARTALEGLVHGPGMLSGELAVDVVRKTHGPPHPGAEGLMVAATIRVNGELTDAWTDPNGNPERFTIAGEPTVIPGPFLTGVSGPDGRAHLAFELPGLTAGDEVLFVIEYVMLAPVGWPVTTDFPSDLSQQRWDFTVTPAEARTVEAVF